MDSWPIVQAGRTVGELTARHEGLYLGFHAACRPGGTAPCRLFAVGEQGAVRLGVPVPEGALWTLERRLSQRTVAETAGALLRGELRRVGEEPWRSVPVPEELFTDPLLRRALRAAGKALTRREEGLRCVALPFDGAAPFPLAGLFCFAQVCRIDGRDWAVFRFNGREEPIFPPEAKF
jgi:hypothetical protein